MSESGQTEPSYPGGAMSEHWSRSEAVRSACAIQWLSADHLSALGLATDALPECRLVLARCRPSVRNDVRLENRSAFRRLRLLRGREV